MQAWLLSTLHLIRPASPITGKDLDLDACSREQLDKERVTYLNAEQRKNYLVDVKEDGLLYWHRNGRKVDTAKGKWEDLGKGRGVGRKGEKAKLVSAAGLSERSYGWLDHATRLTFGASDLHRTPRKVAKTGSRLRKRLNRMSRRMLRLPNHPSTRRAIQRPSPILHRTSRSTTTAIRQRMETRYRIVNIGPPPKPSWTSSSARRSTATPGSTSVRPKAICTSASRPPVASSIRASCTVPRSPQLGCSR